MRLKALVEIYTMHSFAQLCNLNFLSKFAKHFAKFCIFFEKSQLLDKILANFANLCKNQQTFQKCFNENIEIRERCKGVHCVDLGESFPTSIYLQKSASIQPRTSPSKFGGKFNSVFTSLLRRAPSPGARSGCPAAASRGPSPTSRTWLARLAHSRPRRPVGSK